MLITEAFECKQTSDWGIEEHFHANSHTPPEFCVLRAAGCTTAGAAHLLLNFIIFYAMGTSLVLLWVLAALIGNGRSLSFVELFDKLLINVLSLCWTSLTGDGT
jgi:hypothetical protein